MNEMLVHIGTTIAQQAVAILKNKMDLLQSQARISGFVWKNPLRFYPAGLIRINPPRKSQKNPPEGGFFSKTAEK